MQNSKDERSVPSRTALEAAALGLIAEMLERDTGKKPSPQAVEMAAKLLAAKAHRELKAKP